MLAGRPGQMAQPPGDNVMYVMPSRRQASPPEGRLRCRVRGGNAPRACRTSHALTEPGGARCCVPRRKCGPGWRHRHDPRAEAHEGQGFGPTYSSVLRTRSPGPPCFARPAAPGSPRSGARQGPPGRPPHPGPRRAAIIVLIGSLRRATCRHSGHSSGGSGSIWWQDGPAGHASRASSAAARSFFSSRAFGGSSVRYVATRMPLSPSCSNSTCSCPADSQRIRSKGGGRDSGKSRRSRRITLPLQSNARKKS